MAGAQAAQDIGAILSLICKSSERKIEDLVQESTGPMVFSYFVFLENYHVKPRDLDELVDGLLFLDIRGIQMKRQHSELEQRYKR